MMPIPIPPSAPTGAAPGKHVARAPEEPGGEPARASEGAREPADRKDFADALRQAGRPDSASPDPRPDGESGAPAEQVETPGAAPGGSPDAVQRGAEAAEPAPELDMEARSDGLAVPVAAPASNRSGRDASAPVPVQSAGTSDALSLQPERPVAEPAEAPAGETNQVPVQRGQATAVAQEVPAGEGLAPTPPTIARKMADMPADPALGPLAEAKPRAAGVDADRMQRWNAAAPVPRPDPPPVAGNGASGREAAAAARSASVMSEGMAQAGDGRNGAPITPAALPAPPPPGAIPPSAPLIPAMDGKAGAAMGDESLERGPPAPPAASAVEVRAATQATTPAAPTRGEAAAVLRQLADALPGTPAPGSVELTLNPPELGRVRLSLAPSEAGIAVLVQAERPETLDLIRRHADQLAQDFRAMGYGATAFAFWQAPDGPAFGAGGMVPGAQDTEDPSAPPGETAVAPQPRAALAGLDLRL